MIITQEIYNECKKLAKKKGYKLQSKSNKICFLYFELSNDDNVLKFYDFYNMFDWIKSQKDKIKKPQTIENYKNISIFDL